jgi:hypothetical protein
MKSFQATVRQVIKTGKGKLPGGINMANLSDQTGWTLTEIRQQPAWFIEDIVLLKDARIQAENAAIKKANRSMKPKRR